MFMHLNKYTRRCRCGLVCTRVNTRLCSHVGVIAYAWVRRYVCVCASGHVENIHGDARGHDRNALGNNVT